MGDGNALVSNVCLLEDAFYYFTIARRFVAGEGFTLDGVNQTNGFHILHMALLLPGAALFSQWDFLRYALILGVVVHVLTSVALYRLAGRLLQKNLAFITASIWALALSSRLQHLNGMETGLFLLLFILVAQRYLDAIQDQAFTPRRLFKVGLLLGLCYLARVDAVFLGLALAADLLFRLRKRAAAPLCSLVAGAAMLVLPWLVASWLYCGNPLPDSGQATRLVTLNLGEGYYRVQFEWPEKNFPGPWDRYLWQWSGINLWFFNTLGLLWSPPFSWLLWTSSSDVLSIMQARPVVELWLDYPILIGALYCSVLLFFGYKAHRWGIGVVFNAAAMVWIFHALLPAPPWYAVRYMALWALLWTIIAGFLVRELLRRKWWKYLLAPLVLLMAYVTVHQHISMYPKESVPRGYHHEALWMNEYLPPNSVVGTFQGGIISYFAKHRVVNLDGVVNSRAYKSLLNKRMGQYIRDEGIDYVADWKKVLEKYLWQRAGLKPGHDLSLIHEGWFHYWQVND